MKPIPYSRFLTAIGKFKHFAEAEDALLEIADRDFIYINIGKKKIKIYLDDIFYIESFREYINIHTKAETYIVKMPISRIEEVLDKKYFVRIHKSYIVSTSKIQMKSASEVQVDGKKLPIGRTYKPVIL